MTNSEITQRSTEQNDDPIHLRREIHELRDMLRRIVNSARNTSAAANYRIVHRQLLEEAQQILEEEPNDRTARFMELEAMEEEDREPPDPDGECYRGGEYEASVAHEMDEARKLK